MVFSGFMPRTVISESYGSSVFSYLKNLLTVLHAGCCSLHSHQQFRRVLFSPHPFQPLLFVHILIMVIWTGVRWYLTIVLICVSLIIRGTSLVTQMVKRLPKMRETWVWFLGGEDPLEKEMAAHSSILAWRIPWMEEPGGLQSMGSQRVSHLFMCLLTICMSSSEKCLFRSSAHFWVGLLFWFLIFRLSCISCFYSLEINPWRLITSFTNIFPSL